MVLGGGERIGALMQPLYPPAHKQCLWCTDCMYEIQHVLGSIPAIRSLQPMPWSEASLPGHLHPFQRGRLATAWTPTDTIHTPARKQCKWPVARGAGACAVQWQARFCCVYVGRYA